MKALCFLLPFALLIPFLSAQEAPQPARARPALKGISWEITKDTKLYSPADVSRAAAADISALALTKTAKELSFFRYLSLANYPKESRDDLYAVTCFILNSVSREPIIERPARVGPEGILVRVNLFSFSIKQEAWFDLAGKDFYFHQKTQVVGGGYPFGHASWLDPAAVATLTLKTGSGSPIYRADWLIVQASQPPGYHDLLGLKELKDYHDLTVFDPRSSRKEAKGTVIRSGLLSTPVARNNRILQRNPTFNGFSWTTHDFLDSVGEKNVINNFLDAKKDAAEWIGSLPNSLNAYFLTDGADKRLDEADIKVAVDNISADRRLRNFRSCVVCHTDGIQPFRSNFQDVVNDANKIDLLLPAGERTLEQLRDIRRIFGAQDFDAQVKADQKLYAAAVKAANGLTSQENASLYKQVWDGYNETDLDMNRLVFEVGYPEEVIKRAVAGRINGRNSGVLLQLLAKPPLSIRRDHFDEGFAELMLLLGGLPKQP